jgi:hypothetical protein
VVLSIVVVGLLLYMLKRLRKRKARILSDLDDRPELNQDRAFNRLSMARRESEILSRQGVDVHRAQELIADAQAAFDNRQFDHAYQSAQSAHEALVNARRQGPMPTTGAPVVPAASPNRPVPTTTARVGPSATTASSQPPPITPIPKNRAESQFQIRLLEDELAGLPTRRAQDHTATEARALKGQASAAFEHGDYTGAFRLALRGRRALGSTVESLPATPSGSTAVPNGRTDDVAAAADPAQAAEAVAGGERCPDCGYPTLPGDAFCRGCGRPRLAGHCATCGAPRVKDEPFCGRCGARFT